MSDFVQSEDSSSPVAVVAGATGFIGRHLCKLLQQSGYRVKALVRPGSATQADDLAAHEIVLIELTDQTLASALRGASVVFNLAGKAHTGVRNSSELQSSNVQSAHGLASAAKEAGVPCLIHFSSILARTPNQSAYAASKFAGEQAALKHAGDELSVAVLRPASVYGVGMQGNWLTLIRLIASRRIPPLPKLGNSLSLVAVQDLCAAAIQLATSRALGSSAGRDNAPTILQADTQDHAQASAQVIAEIDAQIDSQIYVVTDGQQYTPSKIEGEIYAALGRKKPSWHSPRVLFFAAAALAELLGKLGLMKTGFGLGSYQNLTSESPATTDQERLLFEAINYEPGITFFTALPELIAQAQAQAQAQE